MTSRLAAAVVRARLLIVLGWIALTVLAVAALPAINDAQTEALGDLVPAGSSAIAAEERAAELFAFPVSSRTVVVERDPAGLGADRLARSAERVVEVNRGRLEPLSDAAGAYGVTNAVVRLPFARERGTTTLSYLLFPPDFSQRARTARAENYVRSLAVSRGFVGVTGAVPARAAQAEVISERLPLLEAVTLVVVALAVAVYLRSAVAPLVTLVTVAICYLLSVRLVTVVGSAVGVSVPAEVEPIVVALLFGVVTDYGLFYMSRFRRRLADGDAPVEASRRTIVDLTPIVLACGLAVAAGSAALGVAELGFLRAFGPGMALAILVALLVALTFLPACLALLGPRLFWPSRPHRIRPGRARASARTERLVRLTVRAPRRTIAASLGVLAAMSAGLLWLELGNPLLRGLPEGREPRAAYEQLTKGFAPGAVSPATIIVEAPGITARRSELAALQSILADQPGVAGVLGPADTPTDRALGAVRSPTGDAARFVVFADSDPLGAEAIGLLANLRSRLPGLLEAVGLPAATASVGGDTALVGEIIEAANDDLLRVGPAVLLAVGIVLVVFLRALVAPLYLVALATLGPLAALGLAVALFQGLLGQPELTYFLPIVAVVLLVSLGSDYNIFLVGRIWDEARHMPLADAIVRGATGAAHAISAAGIVLAASFAALALVPIRSFQQLAFILAAGLLIDAFLVRTVLAPAVIALVGERSGWPGRRLAGAPPVARVDEHAPAPSGAVSAPLPAGPARRAGIP